MLNYNTFIDAIEDEKGKLAISLGLILGITDRVDLDNDMKFKIIKDIISHVKESL